MKLGQKIGILIPHNIQIGSHFRICHYGCIVIHETAIIGDNVTIFQGVTIGQSEGSRKGAPRIGNNVLIGAGAKLLGPISIGDNVTIGANSVVVNDLPSNVIVGGIPAKILKYKKNV